MLADTTTGPSGASGVALDPVFLDPTRETGWLTFSRTFASAGNYTLGVGVLDRDDEFNPSGLLVDNVQLGVTAVPEPAGAILACAGAACLGAIRLRRRRGGAA